MNSSILSAGAASAGSSEVTIISLRFIPTNARLFPGSLINGCIAPQISARVSMLSVRSGLPLASGLIPARVMSCRSSIANALSIEWDAGDVCSSTKIVEWFALRTLHSHVFPDLKCKESAGDVIEHAVDTMNRATDTEIKFQRLLRFIRRRWRLSWCRSLS